MAKQVALVTGASMGLGRDYARLCAKDGMDVILVARSRDKLEALAKELEAAHGITTYVVPADLDTRDAAEDIELAVNELGLTVDVLINNAGFGNTGPFVDAALEKELSMVHVNIESLVGLTHRFAKKMVAQKRGKILLVASTAAFQPAPGMAVYCATKAFVLSFGEALAYELRGTGVTVTTHCPGATATEFANTAGNADTALFQNKALVSTSIACAEHGYAAMQRGKGLSIHGVMNWLAAFFAQMSPRAAVIFIAATLVGTKPRGAR